MRPASKLMSPRPLDRMTACAARPTATVSCPASAEFRSDETKMRSAQDVLPRVWAQQVDAGEGRELTK